MLHLGVCASATMSYSPSYSRPPCIHPCFTFSMLVVYYNASSYRNHDVLSDRSKRVKKNVEILQVFSLHLVNPEKEILHSKNRYCREFQLGYFA